MADVPEQVRQLRESVEAAELRAGDWVTEIERLGISERLPDLPLPDRLELAALARRAHQLVEASPELAARVAGYVRLLVELRPLPALAAAEIAADALLALTIVRRREGDLDEAEELLREIEKRLPLGHTDPFTEAEIRLEAGELLAARGRFRGAVREGRKALELQTLATAFDEALERTRLRIAAWTKANQRRRPI